MTDGQRLYEALALIWASFPEDGIDATHEWIQLPQHHLAAFCTVLNPVRAEATYNELRRQLQTHHLYLVQLKVIPWDHQDRVRQDAFEKAAQVATGAVNRPLISGAQAASSPTLASTSTVDALKERLNEVTPEQRSAIYDWLYTAHNCRRY